jgi:ABC-type antimicrobial peptide transport system permease subunit
MTGNIILASNEESRDDVLFTMMGKPIKLLKDYDKIREALKQESYIQDFLPMMRGGVVLAETTAMSSSLMVFAVNFEDYQRVFQNNIIPTEGKLLTSGDHGVLINTLGRENIYKNSGFWIVPEGLKLNPESLSTEAKADKDTLEQRSNLVLMGFGTENASNLRVPVKGIYRSDALNSIWHNFAFLDIESFRECFGYYTARDVSVNLSAKDKALMESSESDFFGGDIFTTGDTSLKSADIEKKLTPPTATVEKKIDFDNAAYNIIAIKLKPGVSPDWAMGQLRQTLKDKSLPAKAVTWRQAIGTSAAIIGILEGVLLVFVIILFIIAAIIIMNTLSMAAMERTEELGMMRAVGAFRSFIGKMFLAETFMLSALGGGLGILIGVIATWVFRLIRISAGGQEVLTMLFGGDVFQPTLGFLGLLECIALLAIVTVVSIVYPIFVARRITPLDAINRN